MTFRVASTFAIGTRNWGLVQPRKQRGTQRTVAIVQCSLRPYRIAFYDQLRDLLATENVDLRVIYGQPNPSEREKQSNSTLPWGTYTRNRYLSFAGREISWQPCSRLLRDADLIIVEQAVKHVLNWELALSPGRRHFKLALWGHGRNFQSKSSTSLAERSKRVLTKHSDWWFAYNSSGARVVADIPFPAHRITVVNNSVDTRLLTQARDEVRQSLGQEQEALRRELGINSESVGLFVGGLYKAKRLDFLIAACDHMRDLVHDFELIIIGAGPDRQLVRDAARCRPWLHYVSPVFGADLAPYFELAKIFLMPGLVGLSVIDSFVFQTPMVTTAFPYHSPEIEYLSNGVNGIIHPDPDDAAGYAAEAAKLLIDNQRLAHLIEGCDEAASTYSIDAMVRNFADGVLHALDRPPLRTERRAGTS